MAGTPWKIDTRSSASARRTASGANRGARRNVAPACRLPRQTDAKPYTCEIGSTAYTTSSGPTLRKRLDTAAMKSRLRCDSITPFGAPVVPVV